MFSTFSRRNMIWKKTQKGVSRSLDIYIELLEKLKSNSIVGSSWACHKPRDAFLPGHCCEASVAYTLCYQLVPWWLWKPHAFHSTYSLLLSYSCVKSLSTFPFIIMLVLAPANKIFAILQITVVPLLFQYKSNYLLFNIIITCWKF